MNNNTTTTNQYNHHNIQREQMSISSITSIDQARHSPRFSPESLSSYHHHHYPYATTTTYHEIRSPPSSPEQSTPSTPSSPHSYSSYRGGGGEEEVVTTTVLHERRQRNKAASAKYRQKKNTQQHEMRNMINQMSEHNALLERQLRESREENQKLRATNDKLRGKFVAKKLLRQWMDRRHHRLPLPFQKDGTLPFSPNKLNNIDLLDDEDDDLGSLCSDI